MSTFHHNTPHVSHITLRVSSVTKSSTFYQQVIGLNVIDKDEDRVTLGNKESALLTLIPSTSPIQHTEGLYHIAFLLPSMEDLAKWYLYQRESGFPIYGASNHLVSSAFYFNDPDGNGIEVYADTDSSTWDESRLGVRMDTLPLDVRSLVKGVETPSTLDVNPIIGHLHMKTKNVKTQQAFYNLLGFETRFDMGSAVFLASKNYHHHIAFNQWNSARMIPHNDTSIDIDTVEITYPNQVALDETVTTMLQGTSTNMNTTSNGFTFIDPMGINVRLITA